MATIASPTYSISSSGTIGQPPVEAERDPQQRQRRRRERDDRRQGAPAALGERDDERGEIDRQRHDPQQRRAQQVGRDEVRHGGQQAARDRRQQDPSQASTGGDGDLDRLGPQGRRRERRLPDRRVGPWRPPSSERPPPRDSRRGSRSRSSSRRAAPRGRPAARSGTGRQAARRATRSCSGRTASTGPARRHPDLAPGAHVRTTTTRGGSWRS